ncbi:hypothetical protein AB0H12_40315 [Actinosynnema sp. NPDC023794]
MRRFLRVLVGRGAVVLAPASVGYYLWNGITGSADDRWYGEAMVYVIIALTLITPASLIATFSTSRVRQGWLRVEHSGPSDLSEGFEQWHAWTDHDDPMTHPLYRSTVGIRVRIDRIADTKHSIRGHPVVRLAVRGEIEGGFEVVAVVPRIAVPRVGDVVRVVAHPTDPNRYRYAGPVDH